MPQDAQSERKREIQPLGKPVSAETLRVWLEQLPGDAPVVFLLDGFSDELLVLEAWRGVFPIVGTPAFYIRLCPPHAGRRQEAAAMQEAIT